LTTAEHDPKPILQNAAKQRQSVQPQTLELAFRRLKSVLGLDD
jgi:hypothetical protein